MTPSDLSLDRRRILLAEDDYFIMGEMRRSLEAQGAQVVGPAASIEDALDLVDSVGDIDGAVLDINLQGVMAFPVADALMARGVPFLFTTGYERIVLPRRFAGTPLFEKPIEPGAIVRALAL